MPDSIDVRTAWPRSSSSSGHIQDQTSYCSCWAFGSKQTFNDIRCIAITDTALMSVEDTTARCGFFSCFSMGCNGCQPGAGLAVTQEHCRRHWRRPHRHRFGNNLRALLAGPVRSPCCAFCRVSRARPLSTPLLHSLLAASRRTQKAYSDDKQKASTSCVWKAVSRA